MNISVYTDGGARGNPGPAASAFIVIKDKKVIYQDSMFIGKSTNNLAEYTAVLMAVKWLEKNIPKRTVREINFFIDSELAVNQLKGLFKIKNNNLKKIIHSIKVLENNLDGEIIYNNISRSKNKDADFLVNKKLDEKSTKISRPRKFLKK